MDQPTSVPSLATSQGHYAKYWGYLTNGLQENECLEVRAIKHEGGVCSRLFTRKEGEFQSFIKRWSGTAHIYCGVNPRTVEGAARKSQELSRQLWFVVDIDHIKENDLEQAKKLRPVFIVSSGNGYHLYFRLDGNIHLVDKPIRDEVQRRNAEASTKLQKLFGGKIDHCTDPERCLRVPGTVNLKNGKEAGIVCEGSQNPTFTEWYMTIKLPSASEQDFSLACNLARKGLDKESIKEAIRQWRTENGDEKGKAQREDYLDRTVDSVFNRVVSVRDSGKNSFGQTPAQMSLQFSDTSILENIQETRWLVDSLLPEASLSYICGDPKSRKSWLALYIALCTALGRKVFDRFEVVQSPVLYIQLEDGLGRVGVRYNKLVYGLGQKPTSDKFKLYVGSELKFNREDTWSQVIEFCNSFKPKLIVIDTLAKSHTSLENDATEMSVVLDRFCKLRDMFQATVLIVHHLKKPGQNDRSKRYMAGSRVIEASAESMIFVESDPKKNQSDAVVVSKSTEEFGFSYQVVDDVVDSKPCIRMVSL